MKFNKFFKAKNDVVASEEKQSNSNQLISAEEVKVKSSCAGGHCGCEECGKDNCSNVITFTNRVYFPKCFCGGNAFDPNEWLTKLQPNISVHAENIFVVIDNCMVKQMIEDPCDPDNDIGETYVKLKRIRIFGCVHYNISVKGIPNDKDVAPPPDYDPNELSAANFLRHAPLNHIIRYTCDCEDNPEPNDFKVVGTVQIKQVLDSGSDVAVEVEGTLTIEEL